MDDEILDEIVLKQRARKNRGAIVKSVLIGLIEGVLAGGFVLLFQYVFEEQVSSLTTSPTVSSFLHVLHVSVGVDVSNITVTTTTTQLSPANAVVVCSLVLLILLQIFTSKTSFQDVFLQSLAASFLSANLVYISNGENRGSAEVWELGALTATFCLFVAVILVRRLSCCTLVPIILLVAVPFIIWRLN